MTADALERLRELASTAALQQHRYYTDGVETLEHADHTNPFDTCQSADCALVRAGGVETPPADDRQVFDAHDFEAPNTSSHPHCKRCHVPLGSAEADWNGGRCVVESARGAVETPAQEPSEVVCECGHLASEHGSPKPTRCIVRGCGCKKNRAMVEATDVPQQSEDADIVRDITAIVREADETFQRVGGGTRHWVRDCFLPFLNQKGWIVTGAAIVRSARPSPPPATPQEWQPIETAPKDGTRILISSVGGEFIARWHQQANFERFERRPGWQIFDCEDGFYSWAIGEATHWMPLPAAPHGADTPGQETK